jgi:large subunit ribosomal protein L3
VKALIARKIGMTSTIDGDGVVQAVTLLVAEPNTITQIKNVERDGYAAVQLGSGKAKLGKAQAGHYKPSKAEPRVAREFRIDEISEELSLGGQLNVDTFEVGDQVHVTATSKGKGWAGTIKRHNFHRGRKTHGGKGHTRQPGSIGSMYPQKIFKGKKMAGQAGHTQVSVRNLKVALIDVEQNVIGVTGAVPGPRKGIVLVKGAAK